jgi:hypothetical protein
MAYDEVLAQRISEILKVQPELVEKKMFGGIGYLLNGNMACGVHKDALVVRVGPENYEQALSDSHTGQFDITGRPMKGWVLVEVEGIELDEDLENWVKKGVDFALTLPPK